MKSTYTRAMAQIRKFEGGYVNHPRDPGGATNFGVMQAIYDEFRVSKNSQMLPRLPMHRFHKRLTI
ncbi:glycosyl hydrolase family 108 [Sinorhizobium medicae]|uniref:glycosyl hydrolase 108 family protein n=1 Tax=Sinorhizobium medicae TaxID=110321 RepID=UPI00119AAD71|nr:glycosyl hydrolase 108 family protein [Sinorhizobium medicae]TWA12161.1 glycosyl hydrolase family 108 [Sinorhizobium medicae]TWA33169.1 glycosyl hydrolase family 108 [Sinorhizobium medicae]